MTSLLNKFHQLLRESGRSVTTSRSLLFTYLQQHGPVTPRQFMDDNIAVADRASLYRSLQLFKQLGVAEERLAGGRRLIELTDDYDSHHHHLTCTQCGRSQALTLPAIEAGLQAAGRAQGFEVQSHVIELTGICADCKAGRPPRISAGVTSHNPN